MTIGGWTLVAGLFLTAAGPATGRVPREGSGLDSLKVSFFALSQERAVLERENRALRLELELADQDSAYAILDLRSKHLRFKLRGVEVRAYDLFNVAVESDLRAWPDSIRSVAGPFTITQKEDLGPPPVPFKPKPRSPLDILPPDPIDPTPCYYNLCFGDDLVLHVTPGDSAQVDHGVWRKRISQQVVKAFWAVRHWAAVVLRLEAEDRRVRISLRLPHEQAQVIFRTARVGLRAILLL